MTKRLWTQDEVTFHGKHFHLDGARVALKPIQKPHPPVWIAANADAAIIRAARLGYLWYVDPHAAFSTIERQVGLYRQAAGEAGRPATVDLPMIKEFYVHQDRKSAFEDVRPFLGGKYESYADWGQDQALLGQESFRVSFEDLARGDSSSARLKTASETWRNTGHWGSATQASG